MKVAVTGASGLIGTALVPALRAQGHEVVTLVRRAPTGADEVQWDPQAGRLDPADLTGVQAAVHLSGAGISSRRWSEGYKRTLRESRIRSTTLLAETLATLDEKPAVLVSGSAVGFYGDTHDHVTDESGPKGQGFLADLVQEWEGAARPAADAGIRVCTIRTGIVLSKRGGALKLQLPLFKAGLGGRLGSGRQYTSWITLDDHVAAVAFLLTADDTHGPVNLTAPEPVTNRQFTSELAAAVHRPAFAVVPPFALRIALDGFADEGLLIGQRAVPRTLEGAGFTFRHPRLPEALTSVLAG